VLSRNPLVSPQVCWLTGRSPVQPLAGLRCQIWCWAVRDVGMPFAGFRYFEKVAWNLGLPLQNVARLSGSMSTVGYPARAEPRTHTTSPFFAGG